MTRSDLRFIRRNRLTTLRSLLYLACAVLLIACGLLAIVCLAIALESHGRDALTMLLASGAWFLTALCVAIFGAHCERAINRALYGRCFYR
jgi:cell division protein FtsW (lipid II flippase)